MKTNSPADPISIALESARSKARQAVLNFDTAAHIIRLVCSRFSVSITEIGTHGRQHRVVWPRQVATYFIRQRTTYNLNQVAALFGCNASNIVWSVRAVESQRDTSRTAAREIAALDAHLRSILPSPISPQHRTHRPPRRRFGGVVG